MEITRRNALKITRRDAGRAAGLGVDCGRAPAGTPAARAAARSAGGRRAKGPTSRSSSRRTNAPRSPAGRHRSSRRTIAPAAPPTPGCREYIDFTMTRPAGRARRRCAAACAWLDAECRSASARPSSTAPRRSARRSSTTSRSRRRRRPQLSQGAAFFTSVPRPRRDGLLHQQDGHRRPRLHGERPDRLERLPAGVPGSPWAEGMITHAICVMCIVAGALPD